MGGKIDEKSEAFSGAEKVGEKGGKNAKSEPGRGPKTGQKACKNRVEKTVDFGDPVRGIPPSPEGPPKVYKSKEITTQLAGHF